MHAYRTIYTRLAALWPLSWDGTAPPVREASRDALWRRVTAESPC